ncbi:MAG: hypothetical protein E7Z85_09290 [Methanosphaera stadtmanae]|jgi:hypothetical protein|nr:hypothetical protein [Methanosphaera stadtmanae]
MSENKITYDDIQKYEFVLTKVPSLLLGTMIRRNANLVSKFESQIVSKLNSLNDVQEKQLEIILNSDVSDIQEILKDAYEKSGKKQYKQLSDPKATKFLENNLSELKKIVKEIKNE